MTGRALITGISGFTGKYMKASLEHAGYEVYGSNLISDQYPNIVKADLCDLASMRNLIEKTMPDVVIHLGGVSNVAHDNVANLYATNILGSRNLLQALSESKVSVQAVMMVSSANVYGNTLSELFTEESKAMPTNDYAVSKLAMENLCSVWADKLPIFIVRPFNYTGIGQSDNFLIPKIINHYAQRMKTIILGNLDVFREFNDVRQIAEIYTKLIQVSPIGKTVNVCSSQVYSLDNIIHIMNSISGYEIKVEVGDRFVRENEIKLLCGSNHLLQDLIGSVKFWPIADTLRWMYEKAMIDDANRH